MNGVTILKLAGVTFLCVGMSEWASAQPWAQSSKYAQLAARYGLPAVAMAGAAYLGAFRVAVTVPA